MPYFPQFSLLPPEIRDLIWDFAANPAPQIHFFRRLRPRYPQWIDWDMLLLPDRQSGILNQTHLSLTCRAAHAAVLRRTKTLHPRTTLRISPHEADKTLNIALDLSKDIICFGGPDATRKESDEALDWGEWSHVVFSCAKRVAVRYQPTGWDGSSEWAREQHRLWPGCLHLGRGGQGDVGGIGTTGNMSSGEPPFCPRCVANVLRRFKSLEEFWLIVDGFGAREVERDVAAEDEGIGLLEGTGTGMRGRRFGAYKRVYFELEGIEGRLGLRDAMGGLRAVGENLITASPFSYTPLWAGDVKFGLLSWREDGDRVDGRC
ncbi:hypothetical protein OQA88_9950 [Cercophora sp. LCS_1]